MTNFDDEPTKVEMLLSEINNTGKSAYSGVLKPLSIRLPIQTYAKVVAIENFIGVEKTSKNKIINDLLEIAFDQIYPSLSESQKQAFDSFLSISFGWFGVRQIMIKLEGIVLNVFTQQGGQNKKGESFDDRDKVQILGAMDLPNGDVKNELFTLSVENYRDFKDFLNQKISIAVGAMASGRNVIFYVAKGAQPILAESI